MGGACWPTGATGPRGRPAPDYERFLKRQLSLPVSMISQWWVRRSSRAVVILGSPKTDGHSPKARFGDDDRGALVEPAHQVAAHYYRRQDRDRRGQRDRRTPVAGQPRRSPGRAGSRTASRWCTRSTTGRSTRFSTPEAPARPHACRAWIFPQTAFSFATARAVVTAPVAHGRVRQRGRDFEKGFSVRRRISNAAVEEFSRE